MDAIAATILNTARQGNAAAIKQAEKCMPQLEVNELISLVVSVWEAKEHRQEAAAKAAKQLSERYRKPVEVYLNGFAVFAVKTGLEQQEYLDFSNQGTEELAQKMIHVASNLEKAVADFCHGKISEEVFISRLNQSGIAEVMDSFLRAAGIDPAEMKEQVQGMMGEKAMGVSALLVSFYASAAAYKILKEALQDAAIMRENRLRIEEECARSVVQMRVYREKMNTAVSDCLCIHAEAFNAGIAAMDRAILDGDVNGFIRGNVMIQEILNYPIQFRDQNGFDALMDGDTAFVL